jgi:hypothetical protein
MANVKWAPGIEFVSGALKKINKKSQHAADQQMLLATHRVAATTNPNCTRLYLRGIESVTRSTPVTADEQIVRTRFAQVARAVALRRNDLNKIPTDLANFNAQKDNANGKKTMRAYLWMVCDAELG